MSQFVVNAPHGPNADRSNVGVMYTSAIHTNVPKGNSAMTAEELKQIINEKLGKPVNDLLEQTKVMRQNFEKLKADIAEVEADQRRRGIYGLADRQKMAANADLRDTLPD